MSDNSSEIKEIDVAEWAVLIFAVDTYYRVLKEKTGISDPSDPVLQKGVNLLRTINSMRGDDYHAFLTEHMPTESMKRMLEKVFHFGANRAGLPRQALQLRTVFSRGGANTLRKVFKSNKAIQEIKTAMQASCSDDGAAALDKFSVISIKNGRIRAWLSGAAQSAGSGNFQDAVSAASDAVQDETASLAQDHAKLTSAPPLSEEAVTAAKDHGARLENIQSTATDTAAKALETSGTPDVPPTHSQVVGIATAAVAAAAAREVPESLKRLDPEQLDAAMTDGKVVVLASAGSGKTTTVSARVAYLVKEKKMNPARIFVVSFNRKAARELRERIGAQIGDDALKQMSVGTMHGMFRKMVVENGTPEEKAALTTWLMTTPAKGQERTVSRAPSPGAFHGYMGRVWKECFNSEPPAGASTTINKWLMNDITPEMAKKEATTQIEKDTAEWYAWEQGFKGVNKQWAPPCVRSNFKANKIWGEFLAKWRDGGRARLADFSDMLIMARDVLKRDPTARKKVQGMFDSVIADEAQDLNSVQHQIIAMMTENVTDGSDGKSVWLVGDEKQCVNEFTGARPDLLTQFHGKPGWKTKSIKTNYRCLPEIVEHANTLMSEHPSAVPIESRVDSSKPRDQASIVVQEPIDHASGALNIVSQIKQDIDSGEHIEDYAVLTRTNMEQNDYETACIIQGIPYARKGGTSFLKSPETMTVMSYFNLAVGQDFARMQKSLIEVLNKPNRFFLRSGESERIVNEVVEKVARRKGISKDAVNPVELFDRAGINDFLDVMDPGGRWESWKVEATGKELEALGKSINGMRDTVNKGTVYNRFNGEDKPYTTQDLFGDILAVQGVPESRGGTPPTLRDVLMPAFGGSEEETDDPDKDADKGKKPLGNVAFLFTIGQPDPEHPETDPSDPRKFKARIDKLAAASRDLRVDLDLWDQEQQKLSPSERKNPPCVTLSTVHSTKGGQWANTTVVMAKGVFPRDPKASPEEENLPPEVQAKLQKKREDDLKTERQLAYVAVTRAAKNLTIVGPKKSVYGRDSGLSPFVAQAGLKLGQNIPGKNDPTPETSPTVNTVLASFLGSSVPESHESHEGESFSYDRRNGGSK